jgi:hypothetical protein
MKSKAWLLSLLLSAVVSARAQAETPEATTLCFFSLNNVGEFQVTREFLEGTSGPDDAAVRVVEHHHPDRDANPGSSFRHLVESGPSCDGLVISGHHTGSFGGRRADGVLDISLLEQMSCDADYGDFFDNLKGVWLQGCRTLGAGPLEPGEGGELELQADYHMQRVGADLVQDGLEQSFAELNYEFSATLDRDNPLASRYMRVFPSANLFGWTRSSPGEKAGSENSLLFHMAHMSRIEQGVPAFDPARAPPALRTGMARSLQGVLEGGDAQGALAREAWLSHGRVLDSALGYSNPDLNAYPPLQQSHRGSLLEARALGCDLRNSADFHDLQRTLAVILASPDHVAYNFNVLWEVFRNDGERGEGEQAVLREQLVSSAPLMGLLNSKLKSPRTGLLMKIEYYSFYRELTGSSIPGVEAIILDRVHHFLLARDLAGSEYDIRDFRESLLLSVADHELAGTDFYLELLRDPAVDGSTLYALTWSFLKSDPAEVELILGEIVRHPEAGSGSLRGAALWLSARGSSRQFALLEQIVAHPDVDRQTLDSVASVLTRYEVPGSAELVREIVAHPVTGSLALSQVTLAIRKYDIEVDRQLLEDILSHPAVDHWVLQNVARVIATRPELGDDELVWRILDHQQTNADALSSAAIALGNGRYEGESALLRAILDHPRADERTVRYVDRAAARNRIPDPEADFL